MLLLVETITLKELLDFGQTTGLFTLIGFMFRQYLSFRDLRRDFLQLVEWKNDFLQRNDKQSEKNEEKELQREVVYTQILEEVRELRVEVRLIKENSIKLTS